MFLVSPTIYDETTRTQLSKMGQVSYLVAPDVEHYLQVKSYKSLYPNAKIVGPDALKSKGVDVDICFTETNREQTFANGEIKALYFNGFMNKDIAFLHVPSRTLIQADLVSRNISCQGV